MLSLLFRQATRGQQCNRVPEIIFSTRMGFAAFQVAGKGFP
jgi:hypothetical protein